MKNWNIEVIETVDHRGRGYTVAEIVGGARLIKVVLHEVKAEYRYYNPSMAAYARGHKAGDKLYRGGFYYRVVDAEGRRIEAWAANDKNYGKALARAVREAKKEG
jgi:hypothetical protein